MSDPAAARARVQLLLGAALFSTGGTAIKAVSLTGWQVACFRSGIAALTLLILLPGARRGLGGPSLLIGCSYAATLVLFVLANTTTTAASAIFLQSTAPLYLLALGPLVLEESVRRRDLVLMGVFLAGLALLVIDMGEASATAPDPLRGNLYAATAGVTWALTILGLRWAGTRGEAPLGPVVSGNLVAFLACLPWALPIDGVSAQDALLVTYLGAIQIGLAYVFVVAGVARVPAFEASLLLLVEPVLSPLWAWMAHGERPGTLALVGGAVILAATVIRTRGEARPRAA